MLNGFYKNRDPHISLQLDDKIYPEKNYRMIFQVEKGGHVLDNKIDVSFQGATLTSRALVRKTGMKLFHQNHQLTVPFEFWFRHTLKQGVIVYCYTKIFGSSSRTQKLIREVTGWSSKAQKVFLKNSDLVEEVLCSYIFMKIKNGFDSVVVNDRFGMSEEEIETHLENVTLNPDALIYGYGGDLDEMKRCLRNGLLRFIPFNTASDVAPTPAPQKAAA